MKLQEALKQLIAQFGESIVSEARLANLIADLNGYEDYPAMKQVFKELVKANFGQEMYAIYKSNNPNIQEALNNATEMFAKEYNFKKDLIQYGLECILFSLGCINFLNEPISRGYNAFSKGDEDLLNNLPNMLENFKKQYLTLLDTLPTLPKDILHDAPGYYAIDALNQLYAVKAKIAAVSQQLGVDNNSWCTKSLKEKLDSFTREKAVDVSKYLAALKDEYISDLDSLMIVPTKLWIKRSGYYDSKGIQKLCEIESRIKLAYRNLNLPYDDWCETEKNKVLAKHRVANGKIAAMIGIPTICILSALGIGTSYLTSTNAIEQFEQTILLGEQSSLAGDYGKAISYFNDAKTEYDGTFRSSHYNSIADEHINDNVDKAVKTCLDLIKKGDLIQANAILASLPQDLIMNNSVNADKYKGARKSLEDAVNSGLNDLIVNIKQNNGHLDDAGKQKLEQLLSFNPNGYWLNFIKRKEL